MEVNNKEKNIQIEVSSGFDFINAEKPNCVGVGIFVSLSILFLWVVRYESRTQIKFSRSSLNLLNYSFMR